MVDQKSIKQLDLNLLKVFEALYHERNMTNAADSLHLTPSAVSHAMKRLRASLGDPLFERNQNKMVPTPVCKRIAPLLIENLSRLRQILQQIGDFDPASSQLAFRVGMHSSAEISVLPQLVQRIAAVAPNVEISSINIDRTQMTRQLAAGQLDLALDVAIPVKPPIFHQSAREDKFVVLMSVNHALSASLDEASYLSAAHLIVSNRATGLTLEDWQLQQQGLYRHSTVRCQNYYSAKEVLKVSQLMLTLPFSVAQRLYDEDLVMLEAPWRFESANMHLYWHANSADDPAHQWLRKIFFESMSSPLTSD